MNDKIWHLATKHLSDELTAEEVQEWDNWLASSPQHVAWWKELEQTWQLSGQRKLPDTFQSTQDWPAVQAGMETGRIRPLQPIRQGLWTRRSVQLAAGIVVLFVLGISLFLINSSQPGMTELATNAQQQEALTLSEGTAVFLNRDTRIRYPQSFEGKTRNVFLESGEAYFEVARDEQHPFIVSTPQVEIEVLGTAFNVDQTDPLVVSVAHGKVRVRPVDKGPAIILEKGERASWDARTGSLVQDTVSLNFLAWKTGVLQFRDTPLETAIAEISHFFHTDIQLKNTELAQKRLTSTFDHESIEVVLETLALNYGLTVEPVSGGYQLR